MNHPTGDRYAAQIDARAHALWADARIAPVVKALALPFLIGIVGWIPFARVEQRGKSLGRFHRDAPREA
jgi:hypothetical protein